MAVLKGLRWGFFYEYIYITSPWSWRDFLTQRRRWLWGQIGAILHVLPMSTKTFIIGKYLLGQGSFYIATIGTILDLSGNLAIPNAIRVPLFITLLLWLGTFALSGWINSGGNKKQALIALSLAWITSGVNAIVILINLIRGNPRRFEVIEKVKKTTEKSFTKPRRYGKHEKIHGFTSGEKGSEKHA